MQDRILILGGITMAGLLAMIMPVMAAEPKPSEPPAAAQAGTQARPEAVFAVVNGSVIDVPRYEAELNLLIREKFYHRRPPEAQMGAVRREVGDRLIERVLLLAESKRRGVQPDAAKVAENIATFEARNKLNPLWSQQRESLLPQLRQEIEEQNMLQRIEAVVRVAPQPNEDELLRYYAEHREKFTEPERLRLSVILLRIDPGSPQSEWDKSKVQAQGLREQLLAGANFAALARERSGDASAPKGGDMGYLHRGMLPEPLHAQLDQLAPGALSEPALLLEGVAIFRLEERLPAKLRNFEQSKESAAKLWQTERAERQWTELKSGLRNAAAIEVLDPSRYPDVAAINK